MRRVVLLLMFTLCNSPELLAQGPGHGGHGGLPGFHPGPHFGDTFRPGLTPGPVPFLPPSAQTGTGRLGGDTIPGNVDGRPFTGWQPVTGHASTPRGRDDKKSDHDGADGKRREDHDRVADDPSKLTGPARALQERLNAIDHMRDMAMKSGNIRLLQEADALEAKARQQYSFQMEHGNRRTDVPPQPQTRRPAVAPTTRPRPKD